jgi:hypothetical protein
MSLGVCAVKLSPSRDAHANKWSNDLYTAFYHMLTYASKIFQYICKEWKGLSKYLSWFSEDALRNDNRGRSRAVGRATVLTEVHSMPGRGSGPSSRPGEMKNWNYGLQLCRESQEWYTLLRTFFVPDDAFTTPAPDGKTRTFKFNSDLYIDLDEDPDARRRRLLLEQKIGDEQAEPAIRKPADEPTPSHLCTVVTRANGQDKTERGML